ncbi:MAG: hypothetical protein WA821_04185 [Anaerolineales bacterium]
MNTRRFVIGITILVVILATVFGIAAYNRVHAAAVCSPATAISVPYAKDGVGDVCLVATSLCGYINSWNLTTLEVNGTSYLNVYTAAASIAPLNGTYTIHYVSTVAYGHFEIAGTCSGPTATSGPSLTPTRTPTVLMYTLTAGTRTNTPTRTRTPTGGPSFTPTRTVTIGPSLTPTRTSTPIFDPTVTMSYTNTPTRTPTQGTVLTPTKTPTTNGTSYLGNATWFSAIGSPYGGCGITESVLDSPNYIALNVQNSPGDYTSFYPRPLDSTHTSVIGMWNNGHNCGRWVKVTISDNCTGGNDGAQNQPFCHGGTWVSDKYNGATLDMIVADSCYDSNAWCRDDPYHIDLHQSSLNLFMLNGVAVGDMYPNAWGNRHVNWQFEAPPNYTGDIKIGFLQSAQIYWTPIAITNLANGIHALEYFDGTNWISAPMDGDMGQTFLIGPTVSGGSNYQIRIYDVNDQLINSGRVYNFSFPTACGSSCSGPYTPDTYTTTP